MRLVGLSPPVPLSSGLALSFVPTQNATVGLSYSYTLAATGGTVPYSFAVTTGTLPAGLSLNAATGVISGTPTTANADVPVTITVTDAASNTASQAFYFDVAPVGVPTVTSLTVTSGPIAGGTSTVIAGTNFVGVTGASGVMFGSTDAASYVVNSPTQITAVSPAETAATVNITVTNGTGTSAATSADQFTFTAVSTPFATSVSSNGRYILDQFSNPWLMVGDSPHSLLVNLTPTQQQAYFADRQSKGFNCVLVQVVCGALPAQQDGYTGNFNTYAGNFANYNNVAPFTTNAASGSGVLTLSTPNATYFATLTAMVELAAQYGITVMLDPLDTGVAIDESGDLVGQNTTAQCLAYGKYLGTLLASQPNVIWQSGNDYAWTSADDAYVLAIAQGIADEAPHQLQTVELWGTGSGGGFPGYAISSNDSAWPSALNTPNKLFLNGSYTYASPYTITLDAYTANVGPTFGNEFNYEFENNGGYGTTNGFVCRTQAYWCMTCGATGQLYGNHYTWDETSYSQLESNLDTPGATGMQYMAALFTTLEWWNLVPDTGHTFVTAGYGTSQGLGGDPFTDSYCTAALTTDASLGVAYIPHASGVTLTVAMTKMAGETTARWYDPTLGTFTAIGSFANTGTHPFTPPSGTHADGSSDWVLVLTTGNVPLSLNPISNQSLTVGSPYSLTCTASEVPASTYTFSVPTANLPAGLSMAGATGVISGTPTTAETESVTIEVEDAAGHTAEQSGIQFVVSASSGGSVPPMPGVPSGMTSFFAEQFPTQVATPNFASTYSNFGQYGYTPTPNPDSGPSGGPYSNDYDASSVLSVAESTGGGGNSMYYSMYVSGGICYTAAPIPANGNSFQYGQWGCCARLVMSDPPAGYTATNTLGADNIGMHFLLWPASTAWTNEVDYPDGPGVGPFSVPIGANSLLTNGAPTFSAQVSGGQGNQDVVTMTDGDYHTFEVYWPNASLMEMYCDGTLVCTFNNPPSGNNVPAQPMYVSLQAESGYQNNYTPAPAGSIALLEIAWVYIYEVG